MDRGGGTFRGEVYVWDAETYRTVWMHREDSWTIEAVDFSPDSTKLVSGSWNGTPTIWDVASGVPLVPYIACKSHTSRYLLQRVYKGFTRS